MDDQHEAIGEGEWEVVAVLGTDEEATFVAGFLEGCGLPAKIESLRFHQEPVNFGALSEVRVRVPHDQAEEARRLLAEREAADAGADPAEGESR